MILDHAFSVVRHITSAHGDDITERLEKECYKAFGDRTTSDHKKAAANCGADPDEVEQGGGGKGDADTEAKRATQKVNEPLTKKPKLTQDDAAEEELDTGNVPDDDVPGKVPDDGGPTPSFVTTKMLDEKLANHGGSIQKLGPIIQQQAQFINNMQGQIQDIIQMISDLPESKKMVDLVVRIIATIDHQKKTAVEQNTGELGDMVRGLKSEINEVKEVIPQLLSATKALMRPSG